MNVAKPAAWPASERNGRKTHPWGRQPRPAVVLFWTAFRPQRPAVGDGLDVGKVMFAGSMLQPLVPYPARSGVSCGAAVGGPVGSSSSLGVTRVPGRKRARYRKSSPSRSRSNTDCCRTPNWST
jgi:hypothetical protein